MSPRQLSLEHASLILNDDNLTGNAHHQIAGTNSLKTHSIDAKHADYVTIERNNVQDLNILTATAAGVLDTCHMFVRQKTRLWYG